jgi:hypothetical protein
VARVETKAIVSPPGENVGLMSGLRWRVSRVEAHEAASQSQRSGLYSFSAVSTEVTTNASLRPSRDQVRSENEFKVSRCWRRNDFDRGGALLLADAEREV